MDVPSINLTAISGGAMMLYHDDHRNVLLDLLRRCGLSFSLGCGTLVFGSSLVSAADNRPVVLHSSKHWVYFKDKGVQGDVDRAAALTAVARAADPRTVLRREQRRTAPGLFDDRDLPISATARAAVLATGAMLSQQSRWLNAISVRASVEQLTAIRALPGVDRVEPVLGGRRRDDLSLTMVPTTEIHTRGFYGLTEAQNVQVNLPAMHVKGFTANTVIIGILDTGFRRTHAAFNAPGHTLNVIAEHDFVKNDNNTAPEPGDDSEQHSHGTLILSVIGAYLPGSLVGGAYDASFVLCKTEDITSETPIEEDNYVAGLEFIEAHGGDVATSSLGYIDWYTQSQLDGMTAVTSVAVNIATTNGLICCTAAGNEGHDGDPATNHLLAPGDALQVITCGAADADGNIAGFSSDGPSADGRVKPEILARGVSTYCVWPYDDVNFATASGTSLSTPVVASVVAVLAGPGRCWSVDRIRQALFSSAGDAVITGTFDPLYVRGYGVANAFGAYNAACPADYNGDGFVTGDDFDAFVEAFEAGVSACADQDGNGFITGEDFDLYLEQFVGGC